MFAVKIRHELLINMHKKNHLNSHYCGKYLKNIMLFMSFNCQCKCISIIQCISIFVIWRSIRLFRRFSMSNNYYFWQQKNLRRHVIFTMSKISYSTSKDVQMTSKGVNLMLVIFLPEFVKITPCWDKGLGKSFYT